VTRTGSAARQHATDPVPRDRVTTIPGTMPLQLSRSWCPDW
jgi:hypothetical protein